MIKFHNVSYAYANQKEVAVKNVSFEVEAGSIVLCTGASGCGKTTLMRLANGLCPQHFEGTLQGSVSIFGNNSATTPIRELSTQIGTLFQDPEQQFFALTVCDEIAFSHECKGLPADEIIEKLNFVLKEFSIEHIKDSSIHDLSEGQKQKVGLASLHSQNLKALILDEPTANLDPESTLDLAKKLMELRKQGFAIFVVDHRLYWLDGIADKVLIMQDGEIKERGEFSLLYDDALREKYGLREAKVEDRRQSLPIARELDKVGLSIDYLTFAYKDKAPIFEDSSFYLSTGITALIGDNGAGKTTLARIMTGLNRAIGRFFLNGKICPQQELLKHVGIVLQNADHQLHMKTVFEEIQTCFILAKQLAEGKRLKIKKKHKAEVFAKVFKEESLELLERLGLEHLKDRHPQSLSGGEKQRLIIACALAKKPTVLILDEPTSGLDGLNMFRIQKALKDFSKDGSCVLVITHDLELIAKACTHAIVL